MTSVAFSPSKQNCTWKILIFNALHNSVLNQFCCFGFFLDPIVKLLLGSLKNAGCPINIKRHIVCEECNSVVTGGYDQELNQIVVCDNLSEGRKAPDVTLIHELIHMYDYCVGKIDFKNLEHLACTEIRAANLSHCSFISSLLISQSSIFNIKKTHQVTVEI